MGLHSLYFSPFGIRYPDAGRDEGVCGMVSVVPPTGAGAASPQCAPAGNRRSSPFRTAQTPIASAPSLNAKLSYRQMPIDGVVHRCKRSAKMGHLKG